MSDYLTKDGVPVRLGDRTCNDCPSLCVNTRFRFGNQTTSGTCALSGAHITSAHKACGLYPKEMGWTTYAATPLNLSVE